MAFVVCGSGGGLGAKGVLTSFRHLAVLLAVSVLGRVDSSLPLAQLRWAAPFLSGGGYCSEATAIVSGLVADASVANRGLTLLQHGDSINSEYIRGLPASTRSVLRGLERQPVAGVPIVSVCHSEPGAWQVSSTMPRRYATSTCPETGAAYRIGRTMFETDRIPAGWAPRLNAMDEVWVPSVWTRDVFVAGGVDAARVVVVGEPVDASSAFSPASAASVVQLHLPPRECNSGAVHGSSKSCPFRYLSVGKFERRKGFDVLLAALANADFGGSSGSGAPKLHVELIIVTSAYHSTGDVATAVREMLSDTLLCGAEGTTANGSGGGLCVTPAQAAQCPPVRVLSGVAQTELPGVYAAVDAVVQPSRGEGWGRPHVEALAMGLPLIATLWSGPSAYMTPENSYALNHTHLAPIPDGAFAGHLQAEPDARALAALLRHVVLEQGEARAKGAAGRRDMLERFSPAAIAADVRGHLSRIDAVLAARQSGVGRKLEL